MLRFEEMATLEDSFLADLDELYENDTELLEENDLSKLDKFQRFTKIMQRAEQVPDSEYKVLVACDKLLVEIEEEIVTIHNLIRDNYRLKFPDLEFLAPHVMDYARVVKRIGNVTDLSLVGLRDIVPSSTIIAIMILNAQIRGGKPLGKDVLKKTIEACDLALEYGSLMKKVLDFLEPKVRFLAPNLSAVLGSKVAFKLIVKAGGLSKLANMSAISDERKKSFVGSLVDDYLEETEIIRNTPPQFWFDACELLAAKLSLVARVDFNKGDTSGEKGRDFRVKILRKIKKWQKSRFYYPRTRKGTGKRLFGDRYEIVLLNPQAQGLGQCSGTQSRSFSEFNTFSKKIM